MPLQFTVVTWALKDFDEVEPDMCVSESTVAKHPSPAGAVLLITALSVPDADQVPSPEELNPDVSPTSHANPKSLVSSTFTEHCDEVQLLFAVARVLPFKMAVGPTVFCTWLPPHEAVVIARATISTCKHLCVTRFSSPTGR